MQGSNSKRKQSANLESLPVPRRFQMPKPGKIPERTISHKTSIEPPPPIFLKRRGRIDSSGLFEIPDIKYKGLNEVYVPSKQKNSDHNINIFQRKRRRSSVVMIKERPFIPFLNDEEEVSDEELKKEEEPKRKNNVGRKRKNKDDFDFNIEEFKNKENGKFVIKCNKNSKEIKLEKNDNLNSGEEVKPTNGIYRDEEGEELKEDEEELRLKIKMKKVRLYWAKESILIPCALKLSHLVEGDEKNLLEFQDYSQKSVLVQGHGNKQRVPPKPKQEKEEGKKRKISLAKRRSFNLSLNQPEDFDAFFGY